MHLFVLTIATLKNIERTSIYQERFFRNLLMGEKWILKNRYLIINPPAEYAEQPRLDKHNSSQDAEQVPNKFGCYNPNINKLVEVIGNEEYSIKQMMELLQLKHRPNFLDVYLNPAIAEGFVRMLYLDSPRHLRQRYLLTMKGIALYYTNH